MTRRMHANIIKALVFVVIFIVLAVKSMIGESHAYNVTPYGESDLTTKFDDSNVFRK